MKIMKKCIELIRYGKDLKMDLWIIIKQRYLLISIFILIILASLFLLISVWKNRFNISKTLTTITVITCLLLIILSLIALVFVISFGYNS